jgi:hypothetical protein
MCVILARGATNLQRARTDENKRQRAAALVEAARSLAIETGVASVMTAVAGRAEFTIPRRRYSPHKEVPRTSPPKVGCGGRTLCAKVGRAWSMSLTRVTERLPTVWPQTLFCTCWPTFICMSRGAYRPGCRDQVITYAAIALADAIERKPARVRAPRHLIAAYFGAVLAIANPGAAIRRLCRGTGCSPPEWNIDFASALHGAHCHVYRPQPGSPSAEEGVK